MTESQSVGKRVVLTRAIAPDDPQTGGSIRAESEGDGEGDGVGEGDGGGDGEEMRRR